jgi:hypothetical protein
MNPWEILGWVFLTPIAIGVLILSYWFFAGVITGARKALREAKLPDNRSE